MWWTEGLTLLIDIITVISGSKTPSQVLYDKVPTHNHPQHSLFFYVYFSLNIFWHNIIIGTGFCCYLIWNIRHLLTILFELRKLSNFLVIFPHKLKWYLQQNIFATFRLLWSSSLIFQNLHLQTLFYITLVIFKVFWI